MHATIHYPTLRTYRSPSEIAKDMAEIVTSIRTIEGRLNLRDLLVETLYHSTDRASRQGVMKIKAALDDAKDALATIGALREDLLLLEEELEVYRCHRV